MSVFNCQHNCVRITLKTYRPQQSGLGQPRQARARARVCQHQPVTVDARPRHHRAGGAASARTLSVRLMIIMMKLVTPVGSTRDQQQQVALNTRILHKNIFCRFLPFFNPFYKFHPAEGWPGGSPSTTSASRNFPPAKNQQQRTLMTIRTVLKYIESMLYTNYKVRPVTEINIDLLMELPTAILYEKCSIRNLANRESILLQPRWNSVTAILLQTSPARNFLSFTIDSYHLLSRESILSRHSH